jgi:hypothetical protein
VILFLGGNVMTSRWIHQILPQPGDPALWEAHVNDARDHLTLAEAGERADPPRSRTGCRLSSRSGDRREGVSRAST